MTHDMRVMTQTDTKPTMTLPEILVEAGISRSTYNRMKASGRWPLKTIKGLARKYARADVISWLNNGRKVA